MYQLFSTLQCNETAKGSWRSRQEEAHEHKQKTSYRLENYSDADYSSVVLMVYLQGTVELCKTREHPKDPSKKTLNSNM